MYNFFLDLHLEHLVDGVPVKASSSSATHASPAPPASSHPRLFSPPRPTSNTLLFLLGLTIACYPQIYLSIATISVKNVFLVSKPRMHHCKILCGFSIETTDHSGSINFTEPLLFRTTACHSWNKISLCERCDEAQMSGYLWNERIIFDDLRLFHIAAVSLLSLPMRGGEEDRRGEIVTDQKLLSVFIGL